MNLADQVRVEEYLSEWPRKQGLNLILRTAHCRRGRHDFRPNSASIHFPYSERLNSRFIQAGHRTQRPRDQMQLILDYKVGWQ